MKLKKKRILSVVLGLVFLSSCSNGIDGSLYLDKTPKLVLSEFFNGNIKAHGIVQDRSGNIIKSFEVSMKATWSGLEGVLEEDFLYSDGVKQRRVWKLKSLGDGNFEGTADDILDKASGRSYGNAFNWEYKMDLPVDGSTYRVKFEDWMWLMEDGVLVNRSYMKAYGFVVGEVSIFMKKE